MEVLLVAGFLLLYLAAAVYLVLGLGFAYPDAFSRTAKAFIAINESAVPGAFRQGRELSRAEYELIVRPELGWRLYRLTGQVIPETEQEPAPGR